MIISKNRDQIEENENQNEDLILFDKNSNSNERKNSIKLFKSKNKDKSIRLYIQCFKCDLTFELPDNNLGICDLCFYSISRYFIYFNGEMDKKELEDNVGEYLDKYDLNLFMSKEEIQDMYFKEIIYYSDKDYFTWEKNRIENIKSEIKEKEKIDKSIKSIYDKVFDFL